jgi:oligopeptide/dipeptide ABC transporter ATP-binding protein
MLSVRDLTVTFPSPAGPAPVVRELSLQIDRGRCLGILGESGSGKSMTARAVIGLVPAPGRVAGGSIELEGRELVAGSEAEWRELRGSQVSMVFQDPTATLNPLFPVSRQIGDAVRAHRKLSRRAVREEVIGLLTRVGFPDPEGRMDAYPFELSGGLRQRVAIAMALAGAPRLVLCDEPTTNLDVSVQAQVLNLIHDLKEQGDFGVMFISHDVGVVASIADDVIVMYAGSAVERGPARSVLAAPRHPYTIALLQAVPSLRGRRRSLLRQIPGSAPRAHEVGSGCPFAARCSESIPGVCETEEPPWVLTDGIEAKCHAVAAAVANAETARQGRLG